MQEAIRPFEQKIFASQINVVQNGQTLYGNKGFEAFWILLWSSFSLKMLQKLVTPYFLKKYRKNSKSDLSNSYNLFSYKYWTSYNSSRSNTMKELRKYENQIHEALEYLYVENLS